MKTKSNYVAYSAMAFMASASFSALSQTDSTGTTAVQDREPLEEIVVTAKRRSLINLGDLFTSEPEPDFLDPKAMRVEGENLPGGRRLETFTVGDKSYCFEIHPARDPLNTLSEPSVYRRRC